MSVRIISHLGDEKPDTEVAADMLATFFQEFARVFSYVCVDNVASRHKREYVEGYAEDGSPHIVTYDHYQDVIVVGEHNKKFKHRVGGRDVEHTITTYQKKMVSDTQFLVESTACDVLFLLCHGLTTTRNGFEQTALLFGEKFNRQMEVWPGEVQDLVKLSDVIRGSSLVILACCHGRDIMTEYLKTGVRNKFQHTILVFDSEEVYDYTTYILFAWFICHLKVQRDQTGEEENLYVSTMVFTSMREIIKKIRSCQQDKDVFWKMLKDEGCVTESGDTWSILGRVETISFQDDETKKDVFTKDDLWGDFKTLTMVHCNKPSAVQFYDVFHEDWHDDRNDIEPSHSTSVLSGNTPMDLMAQLKAFVMDV
jgi:hypothetical protein